MNTIRMEKQIKIKKNNYIYLLILFSFININSVAQKYPIIVNNLNKIYSISDTLNIEIINQDNCVYQIQIGIIKIVFDDVWENITTNILFTKEEIDGKYKVNLNYYLKPYDKININIPIYNIELPISINSCHDISSYKIYRLTCQNLDINFSDIMTGKFRMKIKITENMYQNEYLEFITKPFIIKNDK